MLHGEGLDAGGSDAVSRLRWGARRYRWALAAVVGLVTLALVFATQRLDGPQPYEATALVVARHLNVSVEQLPRFGEAIFNSPSVGRLAVEDGNLALDPDALIPEKVRLEPVQDSVLFRITAVDDDPVVAASLANLTTAAFVEELNKPGEGVGEFAVQSEAPAPTERRAAPVSPAEAVAAGLVGGAALAIGGLWLLLVLRPRVMTGPEAAALAGTQLVGTVTMPPSTVRGADLGDVSGLRLTARRLFPVLDGTSAFLAVRGGEPAARDLMRLIAGLFERHGALTVVAADDLLAPAPSPVAGRGGPTSTDVVRQRSREVGMVLIDATTVGDAQDLPEVLPPDARLLLVVHDGASSMAVEHAAGQFLPGELDGVIFVRRRGRRTRRTRSARRATTRRATARRAVPAA